MPLQNEKSPVAAVFISKGRPEILDDTLDSLMRQTRLPRQVIVVVPSKQDLPLKDRGGEVQHLVGPLGIPVQRNAAIDVIPPEIRYVAFFDDDFELRPDYLETAVSFLDANPAIVAFSGRLLSNGGLTRAQAQDLIANDKPDPGSEETFQSKGKDYILHGCNMFIRRSVLSLERFDENLPLYAYGEDYEMTMRLERHGPVGKFAGCVGVHLESPGGRVREVQRGYSLVANNWYFLRKGTVHLSPFMATVRFWSVCVGKTFLICFWNLLKRDQSKDWAGRIKGIFIALADIVRGKCHPGRIREL
jgi:GT2 family glycosyltransferase